MRLWTVEQISEATGFSTRTIYRAIKLGALEARQIGEAGQYRVMHDWLVKWLGCDPLKNPDINIKSKRKPARAAPESPRETQSKLFEK